MFSIEGDCNFLILITINHKLQKLKERPVICHVSVSGTSGAEQWCGTVDNGIAYDVFVTAADLDPMVHCASSHPSPSMTFHCFLHLVMIQCDFHYAQGNSLAPIYWFDMTAPINLKAWPIVLFSGNNTRSICHWAGWLCRGTQSNAKPIIPPPLL